MALTLPGTNVHPALPPLLRRMSGDSLILRAFDSYFTGSQPLSYLSPEVQRAVQGRLRSLVINWPRLVVQSLEERLDIDGFRLAQNKPADAELWRIWQANDLDEGSQMAHLDSFVHGRSFAVVWANEEDPSTPKITVESAEQMTVTFEPGTQRVIAAAKRWVQDDMAYSTLFLPDQVLRYEAQQSGTATYAMPDGQWELREEPIPHDLGVVPVVPFINRPRLTNPLGESELTDVIPLVDAINKLATDMMVSAEYHAMPRRWATGIDLGGNEDTAERSSELIRQRWTEAAAGRVWLSDSPQAQMGQFPEATLDNFVKGIEMLAAQIAAIAGLPPHYVGLMSQANPASADAIRSAEASLVKRAKRKQRVLGGSWERVMRLALLVRDGRIPDDAVSMETIWRSPETPTIAQQVDAAMKLETIGMPFRQNLEDLGYTPTQVERTIAMRADDSFAFVKAQLEYVDRIIADYGISRAAALAAVGLTDAATAEARVEARQPATAAELAPPGSTEGNAVAAPLPPVTPPAAPPARPPGA